MHVLSAMKQERNFGLIGLRLARLAKFKRTEIHHDLRNQL